MSILERIENMTTRELLLILVSLLLVISLVSPAVGGGDGPSGSVVVNKGDNTMVDLYDLTYWNITKYAQMDDLTDPYGSQVRYFVDVTEGETSNGTLVLRGEVTVSNNAGTPTYIGNMAIHLLGKDGGNAGWPIRASNVATYNKSATSVQTCNLTGGRGNNTIHEGIGSGDFNVTDENGTDIFAGGLYEIPGQSDVTLHYTVTFDIYKTPLAPGDRYREQVIITFIDAPSGGGSCTEDYPIDADGDGTIDSGTRSEYDWDQPCGGDKCRMVPDAVDTSYVNVSDQISTPADPSIVSIPDFTIDGSTLDSEGGDVFTTTIHATYVEGTVTTIELNSTATCEDEGLAYLENMAWIDAANMSVVSGSPALANISFNCTGAPPDDTPPVIWEVTAVPSLLPGEGLYTVTVNVTDDVAVASVVITVDGNDTSLSYNSGTGLWEKSGIEAPATTGTYTIYVDAADTSDNHDTDDGTSIEVDATPPDIDLESPADGSTIAPGTLINLSVTDDHLDDVWFAYDGSGNISLASPFDIDTSTWDDDEYTVDVWANDTLGNLAQETYTFTIDSDSPVVTLSADPNTTNSSNNVTFTIGITDDNLDTVTLNCNGSVVSVTNCTESPPGTWTCTVDWTPPGDGIYLCNATATDEADNEGTSNTVQIIIDSTPPSITLNSPKPPGAGTYIQAGTQINLTVTNGVYDDLDEVWYSTDGGANTTTLPDSSDPYYYIDTTGLECQYTFDVWAKDTAGNVNHKQYVYNIDNTPPEIHSVTVNQPSPMYPSYTYSIDVNASDNKAMDTVKATVNGNTYTLTYNGTSGLYESGDLSAPAPGTYPVHVVAKDKSGKNDTDSSKNVIVSVPSGPIIVLDSPPDGSTIPDTTPVKVNITAGSYPLDEEWFHSSDNATDRPFDHVYPPQYIINLTGYADGTYTFYVFANDTHGQLSKANYTFTIDSTAPEVDADADPTITSGGNNITFTADVTDDNLEEVWLECNDSTLVLMNCTLESPGEWECTYEWMPPGDGVYSCNVTAIDEAGNEDTDGPIEIIVDSSAPSITVNSPLPFGSIITAGTKINATVTNGVYDDLDDVWYQVDGGGDSFLANTTDPLFYIDTTGLADGQHCFNLSANDTAGNKAKKSFCYIFDSNAPVISLISPPNGSVMKNSTPINLSVTDANLDDVWYEYDGSGNLTLNPPFDIDASGISDGTYDFTVYANDSGGNMATKHYTFTIDSTPPTIHSVVAVPSIMNSTTTYKIKANVTDANDIVSVTAEVNGTTHTLSYNGGTGLYESGSVFPPGIDGPYTITLKATDEALYGGNTATDTSESIEVDSTPPVISLNPPPSAGAVIKSDVLINLSVTDKNLDDVWYYRNGTGPIALSSPYDIDVSSLADGTYQFKVYANDSAGNLASQTYTFTVDDTPPTIHSVTAMPSLLPGGASFKVSANVTDANGLNAVKAAMYGGALVSLSYNASTGLYEGSLTAPGPAGFHNISVWAQDNAYQGGNIAWHNSTRIQVVNVGPIITLNSPPDTSVIKPTVPIDLSVTNSSPAQVDDAWYTVDSTGPAKPLNAPFDINVSAFPDGTYTFEIYANDTLGNLANNNYTFTIDGTPPVIVSVEPNMTIMKGGTVYFLQVNVTDAHMGTSTGDVNATVNGVVYQLVWNGTSGFWEGLLSAPAGEGTYPIKIDAVDLAGNAATDSGTSIEVDNTPPAITVLPPGPVIDPDTTIDATVTDKNLEDVWYKYDGSGNSSLAAPYDIDVLDLNLSDGEYNFTFYANDSAGNLGTLVKTYIIDSKDPEIVSVVATPDVLYTAGQTYHISINVTDANMNMTTGAVTATVNGTTYYPVHNSTSGLWEYSPAGPGVSGNYTIYVTATDLAGHMSDDDSEWIIVDLTDPVITLYSPANDSDILAGTILSYGITHPFPFDSVYILDGGADVPFPAPFNIDTINWSLGTHNVTIYAEDDYGRNSTKHYRFTVTGEDDDDDDEKKPMYVDRERLCPGDLSKFTVTDKSDEPLYGIEVKLVRWNPFGGTVAVEDTNPSGVADFVMPSDAVYRAYFSDSKYEYASDPMEFSWTMCREEPPGCDEDEDCPGDEICTSGTCNPPVCDEDPDCPEGQICDDGRCIPGCDDDEDCPAGQICVDDRCEPGCDDDSDCAQGELCVDGECKPPECTYDWECPDGYICESNACVIEPPECESDADCPEGYECEGGSCQGITDLDAEINDSLRGGPGDEIEIPVRVTSNGTAPANNVQVWMDSQCGAVLAVTPANVPELEPGQSADILLKIRIYDDAEPGDCILKVSYYSDEVYKEEEMLLTVTEEVTPGMIWADAAPCIIPVLLLLLLLLLLLPLLFKKKAVTDDATLMELEKKGKLGFAKQYYLPGPMFAKLPKKLKEKAKAVELSKVEIKAAMDTFSLPEDEAILLAAAKKAGVNRIVSSGKDFAKLAKSKEKLEGVEFFTVDGIAKPKKGALSFLSE